MSNALKIGSLLQGGRYKILSVLGQGGFGITYMAEQAGLERKVAIKEFFMKDLCDRAGEATLVENTSSGSSAMVNRFRDKFLKEARNIAKLDHPNIVNVMDVFEENGTAYYVMKYYGNGSLASKVESEGCLTEESAIRYIKHVASALDYIHRKHINHLDIKPANIMLNDKDEAVLIDFGLAKQYDSKTGLQTSTTLVGISEGYAPMEQYMQGGVAEFSPETDVYALGATLFKLLTGKTPPNASLVNNEGLPIDEMMAKGVRRKTIGVICKAMEGRKVDRTKDVQFFIDGLDEGHGSIISTISKAFTRFISHYANAIMIFAGVFFLCEFIVFKFNITLPHGVVLLKRILLPIVECAMIYVVGVKFFSDFKWYFVFANLFVVVSIIFHVLTLIYPQYYEYYYYRILCIVPLCFMPQTVIPYAFMATYFSFRMLLMKNYDEKMFIILFCVECAIIMFYFYIRKTIQNNDT
ncbi:MAG: serine/threonine protein kinase [Muribaculaceae bacterium]|nr:serine/threonine protein kinase [Muribaculaceae bacterium]